jgi:hypothetical protein
LPNASSSGFVCSTRCSVRSPRFFEPDTTAMYLPHTACSAHNTRTGRARGRERPPHACADRPTNRLATARRYRRWTHCMTILVASVLPAPDSPLTRIDWFFDSLIIERYLVHPTAILAPSRVLYAGEGI